MVSPDYYLFKYYTLFNIKHKNTSTLQIYGDKT